MIGRGPDVPATLPGAARDPSDDPASSRAVSDAAAPAATVSAIAGPPSAASATIVPPAAMPPAAAPAAVAPAAAVATTAVPTAPVPPAAATSGADPAARPGPAVDPEAVAAGQRAATARPRILVVDDEPQVHRFLKPALEVAGYSVSQAPTAMAGLRLAAEQAPAAVLLDLGLPDLDGHEVILRLRAVSAVPIIVVSARDGVAEKIKALDHGADDYVDKPFTPGELLARLRACLRRARAQRAAVERWRHGDVEVDLSRRLVLVAGTAIAFTRREHDLLSVMVRNAGLVLTHRQLLTAVWGTGHAEDVQYLRVYVGLVRQKLGPAGADIVRTAPGIGYRLAEGDA